MGQSIVVNEKPSSNPGVVRFETNRAITGMGHERYLAGTEVWGNRPPDELARRLLAHGSVAGLQINGNVVTVDLLKGYTSDGLKTIVENLYRFYPDAPAAPGEDAVADAPSEEVATAPEAAAVPADATPAADDDAPAPEHTDADAAETAPTDEPAPAAAEDAPADPEPAPAAAAAEDAPADPEPAPAAAEDAPADPEPA